MKIILFSITVSLFTNCLYASPSSDCSNGTNKVESFICSNLFVADLDKRLSSTYKQLIKYDQTKIEYIRKDQADWLKNRNNCENDFQGKTSFSSCVKYLYNTQIEKLEKQLPGKQNETKSREDYRLGNKAYEHGDYYISIKYFNDAYNDSDNYVDRLRALGAAATHSLSQDNLLLAAKYSEKIIEIDPTSEFAINIIADNKKKQAERENENIQYMKSSSTNGYIHNKSTVDEQACIGKCLLKSFGTEICGATMEKFSKEELDSKSYNFVTSPSCEVMVSELLGQHASQNDINTAIVTGVLDDAGKAGLDSDDSFKNVLGFFAKGASLAIKVGEFNKCRNTCH